MPRARPSSCAWKTGGVALRRSRFGRSGCAACAAVQSLVETGVNRDSDTRAAPRRPSTGGWRRSRFGHPGYAACAAVQLRLENGRSRDSDARAAPRGLAVQSRWRRSRSGRSGFGQRNGPRRKAWNPQYRVGWVRGPLTLV